MSIRRKLLTRVVLPVVLVALGIVAAAAVFQLAPAAARAETERPAPMVEVVEAARTTSVARVRASGSVVAAKQITLSPEVAGRIVARSDALEPGGRLAKGDVLVRIDARDYRLAVAQEEARVEVAETEIVSETARGEVAVRQWAIFGDGRPPEEAPLAVRQPQLRAVKANLGVARRGLDRARLNLGKTTIRAPWNAAVVETRAEVGQVVSPGAQLATLVGTDQVWVRVSVPARRLLDLDVPGVNAEEQGSTARILHELGGGRTVEWEGEIIRLESRLESETRTAQLLVAVDDPFTAPEGGLPLLPGTFVNVELLGSERDDVFPLPRTALRDGGTLWVVDGDSSLERREVEVQWGTPDHVFVTGELAPGDRVVTTSLSTAIEGAPVRVRATSEPRG
jgi:RND family efflux transporter MFP subunit